MPKVAKELGPLAVSRLREPGRHAVGTVRGLHLHIKPRGQSSDKPPRSWILRVKIGDKRRDIGLGPFPEVTLAEAWAKARAERAKIAEGRDPVIERREHRAERMTFKVAAKKLIAQKRPEWKNAKHADQWLYTLEEYAFPFIGDDDIGSIDTEDVRRILVQPTNPEKGDMRAIWETKTETASRLRARIEAVIAWDDVRVNRVRPNPARWPKHLEMLLQKPAKIAKVKHHKALPVGEVAAFMTRLRTQDGVGAKALEFAILTATRSGEVREALWSEIDLAKAIWTVPAERMKAGKEHRVPLSKAALTLLRAQPKMKGSEHVFPSHSGSAVSDMTLSAVTRRMAVNAVPHGFRSTFRDWVAEMTDYPREIAEHALAHSLPDKVEAAYRRTDYFEKRIAMMEDWAKFLSTVLTVKATAKTPARRAAKSVPKKAAVKSKGRAA